MADKKKMSVAEILAAARKADSKGSPPVPPAPEAASAAERESGPAAELPAKQSSTAAGGPESSPETSRPVPKTGERPSVKDILAAARSGKGSGAAASQSPAASPPMPPPKPSPKAREPQPVSKEGAARTAAPGALDTSSILAAARSAVRPGPMSKAEAAKMAAPVERAAPKAPAVPPPPRKEAFVRPPVKPAVDAQRRSWIGFFLGTTVSLGLGFWTLGLTAVAWLLGTARFMFPNVLIEPPSRFKVGYPDDFPPGYVENKFKAEFGVWIVNVEFNGRQEIAALSTVCTHLGCTPNWLEAEQKFKCPCHGSGFYKDGINFEGPAPRPLERYAIRLADDGQLEVDKSRKFQEELGQWNDPASYVPA